MDVPSANVTGQADAVIVLLDDLDGNAMETRIAEGRHELGEIDYLFNTNTNVEQIRKIEDFYGLWEELDDVQPLESRSRSWVMDGPSLVAAPEAKDAAATQSAPTESSRMTSSVAWMTPSSGSELAALDVPIIGEPQNLLKKVVSGGAWMNNGDERTGRRMAQESGTKNHVKSERRRREKLNEMFLILKSSLPTIRKVAETYSSVLLLFCQFLRSSDFNFIANCWLCCCRWTKHPSLQRRQPTSNSLSKRCKSWSPAGEPSQAQLAKQC